MHMGFYCKCVKFLNGVCVMRLNTRLGLYVGTYMYSPVCESGAIGNVTKCAEVVVSI